MSSPFKGLKDRVIELNIGGELIKVRPTVADAEMFVTMKKETTIDDAKKITQLLISIVLRANPDEDKEDIEAYVAQHYGELITKIAVLYGFTTEEKMEQMIKKKQAEI